MYASGQPRKILLLSVFMCVYLHAINKVNASERRPSIVMHKIAMYRRRHKPMASHIAAHAKSALIYNSVLVD